MVTFDLIGYMGRLGNQMFQFASTVGISKRLNLEVKFPIENCLSLNQPINGDNYKCNLLECFNIAQSYFIPRRHINVNREYIESEFRYDRGTESISDMTSLNGYFQTEKYFSMFRDHIISQFTFKDEYFASAKTFVDSHRNPSEDIRIVSMHIRRGDYVMYPDHHPVCSKDYYNRAIEELESRYEKIKFLIFSDDPSWCIKEFTEDKFSVCNLENPYSEMCAMTLCDDHIIANSSFSWWGAWLNQKEDKKVVAPISWFGRLIPKDTSDVYCKDWIKK